MSPRAARVVLRTVASGGVPAVIATSIAALVEGGTDEAALRRLVGDAVDLGRARPIR